MNKSRVISNLFNLPNYISKLAVQTVVAIIGLTLFFWLCLCFSPPVKAAKTQLAINPSIISDYGPVKSIQSLPFNFYLKWYGDRGKGKIMFRIQGSKKNGYITAYLKYSDVKGWELINIE